MDIDQIKCSLEFLNTNLEYVYTFVRYQVERLGQRNKSFEPYSSCFISDKDVESILKEPFGVPAWAIGTPPLRSEASPEQTPELARIVDRIRSLRAEAKKKGYTLYLDKVCTDFSLCEKELNLLLLCVLAELDKGFEKIIGYFHNDMSNRELTTGLALDLLCSDYSDKIEMRKRMSQQGMLFKYGILRLNSRIGDDAGKWVSRHIAIENDIVLFLTGRHINTHDEEGRFLKGISFENEVSIGGQKSFLKNITFHRNNQSSDFEEPIVIILGRSGSGRLAIANWICQKEGRNIIVAKGDSNPLQKQELSEPALSRLIRDAVLYDSAIYWPNGDDLFKAENESVLKEIYQLSQKVGIRNIFANETEQTWNHHTFPVPPKVLRIPETNKTERVEIIGKLLDYDDVPSHVIEEISEVYRFERGQLPQVISVARKIAGDITGEENAINKTHLVSACRNQSNKALNQLAQLIIPKFDWRDIVLPDDNIKQLKEITNTVLFQRQVFERWGFGRKMSLGKGISVVFSGQSGTGKTMASEIIAHELKTVLYKIDLSTVVSKYIGETEKNLSKIFEEAEMSNCILLFDEADAIFGKRSTVKDARDRYANIETSYLLQKIEEYQGIVILTTNLLGNIDTAFLRRIKHIVHFPKPDKELRRRIWCNLWPKETPIDKRIDFTYLANNFEFSGGNIRNAAVSAAFLAAKENCPIKASHLSIAIKRETQKLGQIIPEERYIVPELDVK